MRTGLRTALHQDASLQVIAEVGDGEAAVREVAKLQPDVAVLDISMPKLNGIAATHQIRQQNSGLAIILFTVETGEYLFRKAMAAGANGYLLKDSALLEITTAIHVVCEGKRYISSSLAETALQATAEDPGATLSPIERRILNFIAAGESSRSIASQLGLSLRSIENRRSVICEKLGVAGAHSLLKWALEHKQDHA